MMGRKGILDRDSAGLSAPADTVKWHLCEISNEAGRGGGIAEALKGADVCTAFATSDPPLIKPGWVAATAKDSIVFACANPPPATWPWEVQKAGARIMAAGQSDFANQVDNALIVPAISRGALDAQATTITEDRCMAAAENWPRVLRTKEEGQCISAFSCR
jgi:malate dehydrogenase (oxaloacetate-decarboxylating)